MGKEDPYALHKLVCDATPAMSQRDIKQAAANSRRAPPPSSTQFSLDLYVQRAINGKRPREEVIVKAGAPCNQQLNA